MVEIMISETTANKLDVLGVSAGDIIAQALKQTDTRKGGQWRKEQRFEREPLKQQYQDDQKYQYQERA